MDKSLTVRILGKDYSLRVKESEVDATMEMASYLDTRMRAFQAAHPRQHELTTAIITALAVTEELFVLKKRIEESDAHVTSELRAMDKILAEALDEEYESKVQLDLEPQEA